MRKLIVVLLLILGGVSSVVASIGVFAERAVYDEDGFVSSVDAAFDNEDVQVVLAQQLSDATYELIDVDDLVDGVLVGLDDLAADAAVDVAERTGDPELIEAARAREGPSLTLLAVPLSDALRDLLFEASLRVIRSQPFKEIRNGALRIVHRQVTAIIEESEDVTLRRKGDKVILDLGVAIESVVTEVAGEDGEGFLADVEIPEDAGEFVVRDEGEYEWVWDIARAVRNIIPVIVAISAGLFGLAIIISANRRGTIIATGLTLALSAVVLMIVLPATREIALAWVLDPENNAAARGVFNAVVLQQLELQSVIVVAGGLTLSGGAALTGDGELAVALRRSLRPGMEGRQPGRLTRALQNRAGALRLWGLGVTGALLVAWPDPSTRVYITMLGLLVASLLLLSVATSDANWAAWSRERLAAIWDRYFRVQPSPEAMADRTIQGWITARLGWFRGLGVLAALATILFWTAPSFGAIIGVIAATLVYLAVLEAITSS